MWFYHSRLVASPDGDVTKYKSLSSSPPSSLPSRAHTYKRRALGPLSPLLRPLFAVKLLDFEVWAWSSCFKVSNKHPLWFCSLITVVLMAILLDSHSNSFSILESTFLIGHLCKAQIMVNPSSKRLVSTNIFKFLANYSMAVKIIIVSIWCYN